MNANESKNEVRLAYCFFDRFFEDIDSTSFQGNTDGLESRGCVVRRSSPSDPYLFVFLVVETSLEHTVDDIFQSLIDVSVSSAVRLEFIHLQFGVFVDAVS